MDNAKKVRTSVIGVLILCAIVIIGFVLYNILVFRVTRVDPDTPEIPTIAPYIDVYFSKPVDKVTSYTLNDKVTGSISIENNRVRYTRGGMYKTDTNYTLVLTGVLSKSGDKLDYTHSFTAKYMNFSDIPEDIQKASVEKSSSGQIDDPFFNNYFPMRTSDFVIEHPFNETDMDAKKVLYVTFLKEVMDYDTGTKTTLPDSEAEALRTKVLQYIQEKGGTPDKYTILYENEYLTGKYGEDNHGHQEN